MIQTTSSQQSEQTNRPSKHEKNAASTISCIICDAAYTTSLANQSVSQTSSTDLELAFMSTCHFCFRCRRPSCLACWDAIHGICGDCVQEVGLPFRTQAIPLEGVLFPLKQHAHTDQATRTPAPLVCVRPGRFPGDIPLSSASLKAISLPTAHPSEQADKPEQKSQKNHIEASNDTNLRESFALSSALDLEDIEELAEPGISFLKVIERIITFILLIILLTIIALIALAELSPDANTRFVYLLHIDIRSEIAYLVSLIRQLH